MKIGTCGCILYELKLERFSIYERLVRFFYAGYQMSAQIDGHKLKSFALVRRTVQVEIFDESNGFFFSVKIRAIEGAII